MGKQITNVVLVGPMGSGKTSVGRRLACVLKRDFFDSDFEIVARTGVAIDWGNNIISRYKKYFKSR